MIPAQVSLGHNLARLGLLAGRQNWSCCWLGLGLKGRQGFILGLRLVLLGLSVGLGHSWGGG